MGIQVVTAAGNGVALSNSVITRYIEQYENAARFNRIYDQLAYPIAQDMSTVARGSSIRVPFLGDMAPGTTAISEVVDITPQTLVDNYASVTPTSRGEALQGSELLLLQAFNDYAAQRYYLVGKNMQETVEQKAREVITQGSWTYSDAGSYSGVSAACTSHRANDKLFTHAASLFATAKTPGWEMGAQGPNWAAIMHPMCFHDLRLDGNVLNVGAYQKQDIILNFELGSLGPFRLVVSPWAKVLAGAGVAVGDSTDSTFLASTAAPLDTTITLDTVVHLDSNMDQWWRLGCLETNTCYLPATELVYFVSHAAGVVTIVGEGANGGIRFAHALGIPVDNHSSSFVITFGGPRSAAKVYQPEIGEFGQIVGPKRDGILDQFWTLGWKWYGGYGIIAQNRLLNAYVSASANNTVA